MKPSTTLPRGRRPFLIEGTLALIRTDGQDTVIVTAITALQTVLMRRLERLEKKIDALAKSALDQQTIDQLAARLKAANDALASDVSSSTPQKE